MAFDDVDVAQRRVGVEAADFVRVEVRPPITGEPAAAKSFECRALGQAELTGDASVEAVEERDGCRVGEGVARVDIADMESAPEQCKIDTIKRIPEHDPPDPRSTLKSRGRRGGRRGAAGGGGRGAGGAGGGRGG